MYLNHAFSAGEGLHTFLGTNYWASEHDREIEVWRRMKQGAYKSAQVASDTNCKM